jgi:predicted HAD superfamily phosphohydrolase YqeG
MPKEIQIDEKIKNIIGDKLKNSPKKLLIFDLDETLIHSVS